MKIEIENLYGIKNKLKIEFERRACIFAPNGVGKTSLYKGLKGFNEKSFEDSLEGSVSSDSIKIDKKDINSHNLKILLLDEDEINKMISDANDIIRNFLSIKNPGSKIFSMEQIYRPFKNIYIKAKNDLEDKEINAKNYYIESDLINEIKKILKEDKKNKYESLQEFSNEIKNLKKDKEILIESNNKKIIKNYKEFETKIKDATDKIYKKFIKEDLEILTLIEKHNRFRNFEYKYEEKFIDSETAFAKVNELLLNNGISADQIKAYDIYTKYKKYFKKGVNKTSNPIIKSIQEEIDKLKKESFNFAIQKYEEKFKDVESKIEKLENEFILNYNEEVKKLNDLFLKTNLLKWKIEIQPISNYHEVTEIKVLNENNSVEGTDTLINFASSGQKRIISLLLSLLNTEKYNLIVFDDVINSMDGDNISIFINAINNIDTNFIFLTHNYQFFSSINNVEDLDLFIMDSKNEEKQIITNIKKREPLHINEWSNSQISNEENKILFASTIMREVIDNYLIPELKPNSNFHNSIIKIKTYIENTYRHFKTKETTFKDAAKYLKETIDDNVKEFLNGNNWLSAMMESESDEIISNYILDFKINDSFKSLVDYISSKYVLGLKIRFKFEKQIIEKFNEEEKWNKGHYKGISWHPGHTQMPPNLIELNKNILMLNHLNNLRWTPIIEMPIYKINKYIEIINKEIKEMNRQVEKK